MWETKKIWEAPVNSDETYCLLRPAPWPGALLRWAAAPAANPQSWTYLDATRHVDSLRQDRKKVFSCSATLQSYTGVWGRVRLSVHSPPDPSRKLPTAYTHFPPGFLYESLKNWEVLGTGPNGDAPSLTSCYRSRLGKTRMDPSFKGKKIRRKERKEKTAGPSFHNSTVEGSEFGRIGGGAEQKETWSWRTSEGRRRISSSSSMDLIQILFLVLVYFLTNFDFSWIVAYPSSFRVRFSGLHTLMSQSVTAIDLFWSIRCSSWAFDCKNLSTYCFSTVFWWLYQKITLTMAADSEMLSFVYRFILACALVSFASFVVASVFDLS